MAASADLDVLPAPGADPALDEPRILDPGLPREDLVFRRTTRAIGAFVLVLTGSIGLFLGYQAIPTLHRYGLSFFTQNQWNPESNVLGISAVLLGTVEVALVALAVGIPLAFATALYISEYAPSWLRSTLISLIDLMAAVPSIIFGLWALFLLEPRAIYISRWISNYLGWIPIFRVDAPRTAAWAPSRYTASAFIAGLAVSTMLIPLACAVMRGVFAQAPPGEREAAAALGATRWGVIRTVVLPYGRRGIIGGTMLALGRALGETVAVLLVISIAFDIKIQILSVGGVTTSSLIANNFGAATSAQLAALLTAGFVLFLLTLGVNTVAAVFVNRSRSGADS